MQLVHVTGAVCERCLTKYLGSLHAHKADGEWHSERFSKGDSQVTETNTLKLVEWK